MNYYLYKITNTLNNKFYIGVRSCKGAIEKDAYMGSGYGIVASIKKHGLENFKKQILCVCPDMDYAYSLEERYVDEYLVLTP